METVNDCSLGALTSSGNFVRSDTQEDFIVLKGSPALTLLDKDGNVVQSHTSSNLIVRVGRSAIIRMLAGHFVAVTRVARCAVGTGGALPATPWTPIAPTESDLGLAAEVIASRKDVDGFVYGAGTYPVEVTFTTLFTSEAVNDVVSEAGLFLNDPSQTMLARHTFPSMYLRSDKGYSLEIAWNIRF